MEPSDHDLLLETHVLLKELIKNFNNHLSLHRKITLLCLTAGIVGAMNFTVGILLIVVSR